MCRGKQSKCVRPNQMQYTAMQGEQYVCGWAVLVKDISRVPPLSTKEFNLINSVLLFKNMHVCI